MVAKIAAIGGVVPSKSGDNTFEVIDLQNGRYAVQLFYKNPSDLKVLSTTARAPELS